MNEARNKAFVWGAFATSHIDLQQVAVGFQASTTCFRMDSDLVFLVFAEATLLHESGIFSERLVASSLRVG
jgi:hypothetical protein